MIEPETEPGNPALTEAARELLSAGHDAQVAFDCIALGDFDRAHTHALTARVAVDAAVTALAEALAHTNQADSDQADPDQAVPDQANPDQAGPDQASHV